MRKKAFRKQGLWGKMWAIKVTIKITQSCDVRRQYRDTSGAELWLRHWKMSCSFWLYEDQNVFTKNIGYKKRIQYFLFYAYYTLHIDKQTHKKLVWTYSHYIPVILVLMYIYSMLQARNTTRANKIEDIWWRFVVLLPGCRLQISSSITWVVVSCSSLLSFSSQKNQK